MWCAPRVNLGSFFISNVYQFINDLPLYTNNVATDLYADDTTLYMVGETQDYIEQTCRWFYKISLNCVSSLECY